jgi:hypothetical protein
MTRRPRPVAEDERVARLQRVLQRVMERLRPLVESTRKQYDAEGTHPYRGLYISPSEAEGLVDATPAARVGPPESLESLARELPYWDYLVQRFGLEDFDGALMAVALAPELDSRFQRLYAFVQDDVTRRHLSVELALQLLCGDDEAERLKRWRHFAPAAPAFRHGLLRLAAEATATPAWAASVVRVNDPLQRFWLGQPAVDARLAGVSLWHDATGATEPPSPPVFEDSVARTVERALDDDRARFLIALHARDERVHTSAAKRIARRLGIPLLEVSWRDLRTQGAAAQEQVEVAMREAALRGAAILLRGLNPADDANLAEQTVGDLARFDGLAIVGCVSAWPRDSAHAPDLSVDVPLPDLQDRTQRWHEVLDRAGLIVPASRVSALATRFHLNAHEIGASVAQARHRLTRSRFERSADAGDADAADDVWTELLASIRAQRGHALDQLARKVNAFARWEHLVLPRDSIAQLREICHRVDRRERVFDQWGFGERASRGRGVHALFAGPSGTGKTMAAEVIANHLGLDLHRIDLSAVVSKYIGETEKNLERIFSLAVDVILFFDEADALFGKRSEVQDAHDRYANIEISYLLQRMEEYDGLSILATNLRGNIDDAFLRRLTYQVQFPFPDTTLRRGLWRSVWPQPLPRADDVDLDRLADAFTLSGGNIRNVVLGAAFLAAEGEGPVTLDHVLRSLQRELQKVGRAVTIEGLREELVARKAAA